MTSHAIRITGSGPYQVAGAVSIASSRSPVIDAASALLLTGNAKPSDTMIVDCTAVSVSPVRINRLIHYQPSEKRREMEASRFAYAPVNDV